MINYPLAVFFLSSVGKLIYISSRREQLFFVWSRKVLIIATTESFQGEKTTYWTMFDAACKNIQLYSLYRSEEARKWPLQKLSMVWVKYWVILVEIFFIHNWIKWSKNQSHGLSPFLLLILPICTQLQETSGLHPGFCDDSLCKY